MSLLQQSISSMKMFDGYLLLDVTYYIYIKKKKTLIEEIKQSQFY